MTASTPSNDAEGPAKMPVSLTQVSDFNAEELADLQAWAAVMGMVVEVPPGGTDFTDEVAYVRCEADGIACWTIRRRDGFLWLARIADRQGELAAEEQVKVASVEEATARITAEIESENWA